METSHHPLLNWLMPAHILHHTLLFQVNPALQRLRCGILRNTLRNFHVQNDFRRIRHSQYMITHTLIINYENNYYYHLRHSVIN
jgi:hypothetical protein